MHTLIAWLLCFLVSYWHSLHLFPQSKSQVQSSLTCQWLMEAWTTYLTSRPQQGLSQSLAQCTTMNYWWDITTIHIMPLLTWLRLCWHWLLVRWYISWNRPCWDNYLCCVDICQKECNILFSTEREEPCGPHSIYCCGIEGICGRIWRGIWRTKCCKCYQFVDSLNERLAEYWVTWSCISYM